MNYSKLKILALIIYYSLVWSSANAATYYVAKTGSDTTGTGTSLKPFKTILYGYMMLKPGDTLIVKAGVYSEYKPRYGLHLNNKSASASLRIVIKSEAKGAAIIDLLNKADASIGIWLSGSYHTIEGFRIRSATNGMSVYGNYNKIIRNEIYNNGNGGDPKSNIGQSGVFSGDYTHDNTFDSNYVHHNERGVSNNSYYGSLVSSPRINVIPSGSYAISESSIFTSNPLFLNEKSDYRLQSTSLLINRGWNNSSTVKTDFLGVARPKGGAVDIGAHER